MYLSFSKSHIDNTLDPLIPSLSNNILNPPTTRFVLSPTGHIFLMVGFGCLFSGNMFYFPKKPTKREHEMAKKLEEVNKLPERNHHSLQSHP